MLTQSNKCKSQIKGKESENSYQELKRSQKDRHTQTHRDISVLGSRLWSTHTFQQELKGRW